MSVKAFELVPAIERINVMSEKATTQIVCIECCGKNVYFGTDDCFVIHYMLEERQSSGRAQFHSSKQGHKFLGLASLLLLNITNYYGVGAACIVTQKKPVVQLKAASALNRIMVLCDATLSLLNMLNLEPIVSGAKIKGVHFFTINENPPRSNPFSVELCVATKRRCIQVYTIFEDKVSLSKEITTNDMPITLSMDGIFICVGLTKEYNIINTESGHVQDLFDFDPDHVKPIVTRISTEEFLLNASSALGVFALLRGISQRPPLQWTNNVTHVVYSHPYVLALNDEFITVHSVIDQQQKQTISFAGGRCLGEFDGRLFITTNRDVYQLVAIPVEKQVQSLLSDKRVNEALDLARSARKTFMSKDEFNKMLRDIQQRAGFIEFCAENFDQAHSHFKTGQLDVRELLTLYPQLLTSNSSFLRTVPPLHDIADINQLTRSDQSKILLYKQFLLGYLEDVRESTDQSPYISEIDTALVKLYAELDIPQLVALLVSSLSVSDVCPSRRLSADITDCIDWLSGHCDLKHAIALLHCHSGDSHKAFDIWIKICSGVIKDETFPGLDFVVDFLSKSHDAALVWKYADWVMSRDQILGVQIFTQRIAPSSVQSPTNSPINSISSPTQSTASSSSAGVSELSLSDPDVVVDYLARYNDAIVIYLEHLISDKQMQQEKFHTHLAVLYLDNVLQLMKNKAENELELISSRKRLTGFLQKSNLYRVQLLLGKIQHTELYTECAILYGKLEEHDKALRLLVQKSRDFEAAENYCVVNTAGSDVSPAFKTRLFTTLLSVYLDPTNERRDAFVGPAISLLNNNRAQFDTVKVLQLIPDNWSIGLLNQFLTRSIRQSLALNRTKRVERMLARGENLRVKKQALNAMSDVLPLTEDRLCDVCRKCFTDPVFLRFPNGIVTHTHCAPNKNVCPVTGKVFTTTMTATKQTALVSSSVTKT